MTPTLIETLARWARIGAAFNVEPARRTPDLERLILDTAALLPENPRLFVLAASWLSLHPHFVARHRLGCLAAEAVDEHRAQLGLLLDAAAALKKTDHFNDTIRLCRDAARPHDPRPLLLAQRASRVWSRIAEKEAWPLSRRWGLWCQPFELKRDAIRPARWIVAHNPGYLERAVLGGDLRLTILLQLRADPSAGDSELGLAKRCGVTRAAVRHSLDLLEGTGLLERTPQGKRTAIRLVSPKAMLRAA